MDFLLPDLGEGLTEAEIVAWHVKVGDVVTVDQPVVEVETAKAVIEVPVPVAGRVILLHGRPGETIAVGRPLLTVDAVAQHPQPTSGEPSAPPPGPDASGSVLVGYGTSAGRRRRRLSSPVADGTAETVRTLTSRLTVVSPLVRRLARDAGVELAAVAGSGAGGLIMRRDVEEAIRSASATAGTGPTRIPIRGIRKVVADKLSRSRREIPEATVWVDVDVTDLLELRRQLNADTAAPGISLLALVSRFAVVALGRFAERNARVAADEIVMDSRVHLGFAAQTARGLVVPVVPDAQALTLEQLSVALAERTRHARDGTLAPSDLSGGTFTVNNYGVFGVDGSAAIINYPEVALLGIGRIIERPWVVGGRVEPRKITQLTLVFDHRVCDGGTAGGFLRLIANCVEVPGRAMRHL